MTTDVANLTGPRWSQAVRCTRAAAYQALGVEGLPYSEDTLRRFMRGTHVGRAMADTVVAEMASQGRTALTEVECYWPPDDPIGVGHADLYLPDESTVDEVYSTTDTTFPRMKALQVVGYCIALGATEAKVLVVNPNTYECRVYPVNVEALRSEVEGLMAEVATAVRDGVIPERLNGDPKANPGSFDCQDCPFRMTCWEGWEPPPAGSLPGCEDDLVRLVDLEREIKRTPRGDHVLEMEAERDAIRERLRGLMEPGVDYYEAGIRVRRTEVNGRRSFSFSAAEAAGFALPADLLPFISEGKPSDRWLIREVGP